MRCAVYHPPHHIEIEDHPIPAINDEEILLKINACGICGTDVLKVNRALPKKPLILGHELAGVVEDCGKKVHTFQPGDRIVVAHHVPCGHCHFCRHGHEPMCRDFKQSNLDPGGFAEYLRIPAPHVKQTTFKLPHHLSNEEGLFTEPLSCCVRNLRRANLQKDDFVVIIGMGSIGLMTLQLLKLQQAKVLAVDLKEKRLTLAKDMGADWTLLGQDPNLQALIKDKTQDRGADLIILTAGGGGVFQNALTWLRDGGSINLFASLTQDTVPINLDFLYHHEIKIFSSYSPAPQDLKESHRLLCEGQVNVKPLITHHLPLEQLQHGIDLINQQQAMKVIIHPNGKQI